MRLAVEVYTATSRMPENERFGLTAQMRRAAVSIPSNIAEGYGRNSLSDYLRFLRVARGSLLELETQLLLSMKLGFLTNQHQLTNLLDETGRVLQGLISSLQTSGHSTSQV